VTRGSPSPAVPPAPAVHVVEDDDDARVAMGRVLKLAGYTVRSYTSANDFLAQLAKADAGCLILDVHMPGTSGLELQSLLSRSADVLPIVFVSGRGDIPMTVRAMKNGAVDFLTKPVPKAVLLAAVSQAMARWAEERAARDRTRAIQARYDRLTPREREVFAHLIGGQLNKQVAYDLGTAERTIKAHRHSILQKLEADSIADLVTLASELGIEPVRKA
jgi:FixJ family two-component response regulator